jgi:predicted SprT family Zn-dependent metalloprotease
MDESTTYLIGKIITLSLVYWLFFQVYETIKKKRKKYVCSGCGYKGTKKNMEWFQSMKDPSLIYCETCCKELIRQLKAGEDL